MGREISAGDRKVIAAFDFDGTITRFDTLPRFISFAVDLKRKFIGTLIMMPYLVLMKLKVISNHEAKAKLFKTFFAETDLAKFNLTAERFASKIDSMINPAALKKLQWHKEMGHEVIIISASAENWIDPWARKQAISIVLATQLKVEDNKITGSFSSPNCYGEEKVVRLLEMYPERDKYILYAYGDSKGDRELLKFADYAFYRKF